MAVKHIFALIIILFSFTALAQGSKKKLKEKQLNENAKFEKALEKDEVKSEDYSESFKASLWSQYETKANNILRTKKTGEELNQKQEEYGALKEKVEALEYKEDEMDKKDEAINAHVKLLNDRIYHKTVLVFLDYISWQREATIKSPTKKGDLIITNIGVCGGGSYGYKNAFTHFFADGCAMTGYGNIAESVNNLTYRQSNVPYYGFKIAPGAGLVVSSLGAEAGLKIPLVYSHQKLDTPDQTRFPGFKVSSGSDFMAMGSFYARWPFGKWFVQTEFARVLDKDLTFWNIGAGLNF